MSGKLLLDLSALPGRLAFLFIEDCRVVEKLVKETFSEQGPGALIVYVGNKPQFVELPQISLMIDHPPFVDGRTHRTSTVRSPGSSQVYLRSYD